MENITLGQIAIGLAFVVTLWGSIESITKKLMAPLKKIEEKVDKLAESDSQQRRSLVSLLRERMLALYSECEVKGSASINQKFSFDEMFQQYISLGGNGFIKDIHNKMMSLPEH